MKDMIYGNNGGKIVLLDYGTYEGYDYAILNIRGSHPCCYVRLPFDHRLADDALEDYNSLVIHCHGGITYSEKYLRIGGYISGNEWVEEVKDESGVWIGWDYAHAGDYIYYTSSIYTLSLREDTKYTTEELLEDVKDVIDQIVEGDENGDEIG